MADSSGFADKRVLTREHRLQCGHDRRDSLSHKKLGELNIKKRGRDPLALLRAAEKDRIAKLLPEKYARMSCSAFAFFRGAVGIMAWDLAKQPHTEIEVQLCGDAHLQNLGCFAAPDGRLVFDINDFDETTQGPWEWDVKRMATSIVLAGGDSEHSEASCAKAVEVFVAAYCRTIAELAKEPILLAARHVIHRMAKAEPISAALQQAERAKPSDLLKKYTEKTARNEFRFKNIPRQIWRVVGKERQAVLKSLDDYRDSLPPERLHLFDFYFPMDVGFKIVGTGSVGLRDYVVLMGGCEPKDVLFLQIKQEVKSAYAPYLKQRNIPNEGQRVVEGQHRIQPMSDLMLGWTRSEGFDYLVRQLNDHKGSIAIENLRGKGLASLAEVAGELLARGHTRSGDVVAIHGYIGTPEKILKGITKFAKHYAEQAREDFAVFQSAIKEGKIKVAKQESR